MLRSSNFWMGFGAGILAVYAWNKYSARRNAA